MSRRILAISFLAVLFFSGCSISKTETPRSSLPTMESNWVVVSMTHSGGIMGLSRSIEISLDGKYTVTDERDGRSISNQLGTDELTKLKEIITNSEYIVMESPQPSGCADCFIYDLVIQGSGKGFSVHLDDISLPDSGMETLVTYLRELIDTALKQK